MCFLIHHFTSAYKQAPFRFEAARSLRVYGTRGSLVGDRLLAIGESGRSETFPISVELGPHADAAARRIEARLPGGARVEWRSAHPELGFSDAQLALASHLEAMAVAITIGEDNTALEGLK